MFAFEFLSKIIRENPRSHGIIAKDVLVSIGDYSIKLSNIDVNWLNTFFNDYTKVSKPESAYAEVDKDSLE